MSDSMPRGQRYIDLLALCPLCKIQSEDELDRAIAVIDSLIDQSELTEDEYAYLDALGDLVEEYEDKYHPM